MPTDNPEPSTAITTGGITTGIGTGITTGIATTRRTLLRGAMLTAGGFACAPHAFASSPSAPKETPASYVPLLDLSASARLFLEGAAEPEALVRNGQQWQGAGCVVASTRTGSSLEVSLQAAHCAVERVQLRWTYPVAAERLRVLGDAWERSYGELGWREVIPERPMPWYMLTYDGTRTHGYGVACGAGCFAFWQMDSDGISLWLDVRNGGKGVMLGERTLHMAAVVTREGLPGERPLDAAIALCAQMSPDPRPLMGPIYGSNDWYYAYGNSSADDILRDADLMATLAPSKGPRPFTIADEGWDNSSRFPDMAGLASSIRKRGVRPGIWIRPLAAESHAGSNLLLPTARFATMDEADKNPAYDPTIPEALALALAKVRQAKDWGFELIKHDFSTYDLMGQWGFAMQASPALPGWSFQDRSRTSAEIIRELYREIRRAAGDAVIIGCNTVGQLAAGIFESQRIGDDVSGKIWERTRRMGVNTLGFRIAQHRTYSCVDPDCIPFTRQIPWNLTRQWLEVVARSGAALVISPERDSFGPDQQAAVREAFALVASNAESQHPQDWLETHTPSDWAGNHADKPQRYSWIAPYGAFPFTV
jgi:alpha-galactosidase